MENIDYKTAKEFAIENEPVYKKMDIDSVRLLDNDGIELNGKSFMAEESFIQGFTNQIGLENKTINQLSRNMSKEDVRLVLNKSFSNYFRRKGAIRANIIGDRASKTLFRLNRGEVIPYSTIFAAVDKVEAQYNRIEATIEQGDIRLLMNESEELHIEGLIKEAFSPNVLLNYSYGESLGIAKVIERLTCTNQITQVMAKYGQMNLAELNSPVSIIKKLTSLRSNNINQKYSDKVMHLQEVKASVEEYEIVSRLLSRFIGKKDNDMMNLFLQKDKVEEYIRTKYTGIDLDQLINRKQVKSQMELPIDYWFLINSITDFASHNYRSLNSTTRDMLKEKAFKLMNRTPDIVKFEVNYSK